MQEMEEHLLPFVEQKLPLLILANKMDVAVMVPQEVLQRIRKSAIGHPIHLQPI